MTSGDSGPDHLENALPHSMLEGATPDGLVRWLRTRGTGAHLQMSVHAHATTITAASAAAPSDPAAEYACWRGLRAAVSAALNGDTGGAATLLPAELTAAEWVQDGHTIRIRRPGTTTRALHCARRKLGAFTPLPLLATLTQPLAGGATAAGILLAPIPVPSLHEPPPISMPALGRPLTGDVYRPAPAAIPGAHPVTPAIGPGAPLFPGASTPTPVVVQPADATGRDTAPTAPEPQPYTPPPAVQRTTPNVNPAPSAAPTVSPSPKPSPTTTGILDETSPTPSPTPTPTPTPPPVSTRMIPHHQHKPHHLRHIPRWH